MTPENLQRTPSDALWTNPSVALWSTELLELLDGKREPVIEHLASAAEYTEDQVMRSTRQSESRAYLVVALDQLVKGWNATPHDAPDFLSLLFDLLRRYTPPNGFPKLMRFLELQNVHGVLSPEYQRALRLQRKALHAMENYFPAAPASPDGSPTAKDSAFQKYVNLLTNLISHPGHAAYAMRSLFKLAVLRLDGDDIVRALADYPSGIRGILQYLLEPEHHVQAEADLGQLYNVCLRVDAEKDFRVELQSLGAVFEDAIDAPYVLLPQSSKKILIRILEDNCLRYAELFERRNKASLKSRVRQLLTTVQQNIGTGGKTRNT